MRLYKAKTLAEYIDQLKLDLEILQHIDQGPIAFPIQIDDFNKYRDTIENHSEILSVHNDNKRHEAILRRQGK